MVYPKLTRFAKAKPLDHILDVGQPLDRLYLILRGCVRVWAGSSRMDMRHQDDIGPGNPAPNPNPYIYTYFRPLPLLLPLSPTVPAHSLQPHTPGEIFGEAAVLSNLHTSQTFAQALTDVDFVTFEADRYCEIARSGHSELSIGEKEAALRGCSAFRTCDPVVVAKMASLLVQEEIPRGRVLFSRGQESAHLSLIVSGAVMIVAHPTWKQLSQSKGLGSAPSGGSAAAAAIAGGGSDSQQVVALLQTGQVFGESGFLNTQMNHHLGISNRPALRLPASDKQKKAYMDPGLMDAAAYSREVAKEREKLG